MSKQKNEVTLYPLSLNGDTFNAFKSDFDQMLRQLLTEMERRESEEATISVKMAIKLEPDQARDYLANGYDGTRDIIKPSFKHEISTMMQVKNKKSGSLGGNMEMVWDKELRQYVMRPIDNGQVSFFDGDDKHTTEESQQPEVEVPEQVHNSDPIGLPPAEEDYVTVDDNIIDAEVVTEESGQSPQYDSSRVINWLAQFMNADLKVMEAMGNITVRTEDGKVVLSSAAAEDSHLYCHAEILKPYVGKQLSLMAHYGDNSDNIGNIVGITLVCNEDDCAIAYVGEVQEEQEFEVEEVPAENDDPAEPTEDLGGYEYETPVTE